MFSLPLLLVSVAAVSASWSDSSLKKYVDTLELTVPLVPVIGAEFTGGPHHQRTPFAVSTIARRIGCRILTYVGVSRWQECIHRSCRRHSLSPQLEDGRPRPESFTGHVPRRR
jgi:hypothetical protein